MPSYLGMHLNLTIIHDLCYNCISIFIKENLQYKVREDLNVVLPYMETLFIELTFNSKLYLIGVIYRVPNTNVHVFNETLNGIIEPIKTVMK